MTDRSLELLVLIDPSSAANIQFLLFAIYPDLRSTEVNNTQRKWGVESCRVPKMPGVLEKLTDKTVQSLPAQQVSC